MKALVALILLVQLPVHKAIPAAPPAPLGCDDPESEAAAEVAVSYINAHSHHGYKFVLNRIENIRVLPQGLNNDIIFLELDLLETACHILSPTPLPNCTVRSFTEHAVEGDCDVKLQKLDGKLSVLASKCHSHADSSEDVLQLCPDCPLLASLNNTEVLTTVTAALSDHNSKTTDAYLRLLEIGRAKIQYHPAHTVSVEFAVAATNCSAKEAKDNVEACQLLPDDQSNFGFCTATMVTRPSQDLRVDCQLYGHQPGVTYSQAGQDTSAGLVPSVVQGFTNHNLRLSHNNPFASESSSSEFPSSVLSAKSVAKRAAAKVAQHDKVPHPVGFAPPLPPPCPGKIRHFKI
ncbi:alpha-2-HS-glycoprotein [Falco biarmicus]|uniref:alpha-2-HS-glycoprotein n=1 Tax=Falco peregrinus TaxID=8954 RepID=UPI000392EA0D|nr:alpha-2-HS-glycoprotein [Falco peregrinus]XP_005438534.1 alpha-2-HS-glycoprotein [Falco cherrug]XP_037262882.1 alpha-2-HS-glycoprotein [Falco rusticolus]XP_056213890.1 alpha-2-HS-glycoprotein [Falco biarmicus]